MSRSAGSPAPSSGNGGRHPQRPQTPRRVRQGLRLRSREGPQPENWIAERFLKLLETTFDADRLAEGLEYARSGQTVSLDVRAGGAIEANVQGRAARPYTTRAALEGLTDAQWHELIVAMAAEAMYAAKLLDREMPPALDDLFSARGLELLPARKGALSVECTCRERKPCKHAAAAALLMVDRLATDPSLVFDLHGMSAERVLERLRQARAMQAHGATAFHGSLPGGMIPESQLEPPPLEACLDEFWRCGPQLAELEHAPPPQHVAHALLRRLGPSPMNGKFPLVGLLASVYDEVAAAAIRIRDQAERLSNGGSAEPPEP